MIPLDLHCNWTSFINASNSSGCYYPHRTRDSLSPVCGIFVSGVGSERYIGGVSVTLDCFVNGIGNYGYVGGVSVALVCFVSGVGSQGYVDCVSVTLDCFFNWCWE